MIFVYNDPHQKKRRQELRNNPTQAEALVWEQLKEKRCSGIKFRSQFGVGPYILDFYCTKKRLAIEIDGSSHFTDESKKYDDERNQYLEQMDIRTIRFTNDEVYSNLKSVISRIIDALNS